MSVVSCSLFVARCSCLLFVVYGCVVFVVRCLLLVARWLPYVVFFCCWALFGVSCFGCLSLLVVRGLSFVVCWSLLFVVVSFFLCISLLVVGCLWVVV